MLDLEFSQLSDRGRVHDYNEDYLGQVVPGQSDARANGWLFALADGVGGNDRGAVASRVAIESMLDGFRKADPHESLTVLLPRLVQSANTRVFEAGTSASFGGGKMATTIVACALRRDRAVVSHAGDSRCYLVRQGYAAALTRDHILSNERSKVAVAPAGKPTASQATPVLSRSLGNSIFLSVDTSENQILTGDVLLLCSGGLHNSVGPADIGRIAGHGAHLPGVAEELVGLARQRDGRDNISVLLIRVRSVERAR